MNLEKFNYINGNLLSPIYFIGGSENNIIPHLNKWLYNNVSLDVELHSNSGTGESSMPNNIRLFRKKEIKDFCGYKLIVLYFIGVPVLEFYVQPFYKDPKDPEWWPFSAIETSVCLENMSQILLQNDPVLQNYGKHLITNKYFDPAYKIFMDHLKDKSNLPKGLAVIQERLKTISQWTSEIPGPSKSEDSWRIF